MEGDEVVECEVKQAVLLGKEQLGVRTVKPAVLKWVMAEII